jgi:hypothetical protein
LNDFKIALLQIACGFARETQKPLDTEALSPVDTARSKELIKFVNNYIEEYGVSSDEFEIWTSGVVSYNPGDYANTLSALNAKVLADNLLLSTKNWRQVPGLNGFGEISNACKMAKIYNISHLIVITSGFYLNAYQRVWLAAGERHGIRVEIIRVKHPQKLVSDEVLNFYTSTKMLALSYLATTSDIGHNIAKYLTDLKTQYRADTGFKFDGYSKIG